MFANTLHGNREIPGVTVCILVVALQNADQGKIMVAPVLLGDLIACDHLCEKV